MRTSPPPLRRWALLVLAAVCAAPAAAVEPFDVVVYGATPGGIVAAVAAAREGASVALVAPGRFIGGMTSGGFGWVAPELRARTGGIAREFYHRVGAEYGHKIAWSFEPHVAESVFERMVEEAGVKLFREERLREDRGVKKKSRRIRRFLTEAGTVFAAKVFLDATYEGDLMAGAGVAYDVGEQSRLPPEENYSFALCLTEAPTNRVEYPKPATYDAARYGPWLERIGAIEEETGHPAGFRDMILSQPLPDGKIVAWAATGSVGVEYLEAAWRERMAVWQAHMDFTAGLFYFLAREETVPEAVRREAGRWGLCADEFAYSDHWPPQLHIPAGRRMRSAAPLTWQDAGGKAPDTIGLAEFRGRTLPIPYRILCPPEKKVRNLLVVVSASAGSGVGPSLRRDPTAMVMGHAAGVAAAMAVSSGAGVRQIDAGKLRAKLAAQGALLNK